MLPPADLATHWPISGQSGTDSIYLSRTFSSRPFWKSPQVKEHLASSEEKPLSCRLLWTFQHGRSSLKTRGYILPATQTNQPCCLPHELPDTPSAATGNTFYPLKNQRTTCDTKKNLFSLWLKFTSAIRINLLLLGFKEVLHIDLQPGQAVKIRNAPV